MKKAEKIKLFVLAFIFGIVGGGVVFWVLPNKTTEINYVNSEKNQIPGTNLTSNINLLKLPDFSEPAENAVNAVVYIKTEYYSGDPVNNFFYGRPSYEKPLIGSGSGVIISKDGYIVTNNHVIDKATNITITLNDKREYTATLIGRDASIDLALLKIDADSLSTLAFGNSDDLKIGEWVLAIGNPFNLTSTVTAGIVSAKARNINILKKQYALESYIQTDAAVNPGNSGGALVNINGELIGINSAIASPTGSYSGYSFAIPSSIVKKAVEDFLKYGSVQRAYLGVKIASVDKEISQRYNLPDLKGIYISSIFEDGSADVAGLKEGDVILKCDGTEVNEVALLLDLIGRKSPGNKIILTVRRDGDIKDYEVILKNEEGGTENIVNETRGIFGATFEDLTKSEKKAHGLKNGVRVNDVFPGKFLAAGIKNGYIITKINDKKVDSVKELEKILEDITGGIYIEGYDPETGKTTYFAFGTE